jgi:TusA-related sulfurtransferase
MSHDPADAVFLDNRGLEPPLPMVRTLEAYERLAPGERLRIHNDRVPVYLLPQLEARGATYEVDERPGGDAFVTIRRPADAPTPETER